jgi:hypothetical protein
MAGTGKLRTGTGPEAEDVAPTAVSPSFAETGPTEAQVGRSKGDRRFRRVE